MIDLYYWPTPNGWKVSILLEELGVPYTVKPVNITKGDQFEPAFLKIAPNNRMPAIVDHEPGEGAGGAVSVFESGAILKYLATKHGRFYPRLPLAQVAVDEWLFWQVGGLGPMAGQAHHFRNYAPEKIPYAIDRYTNEVGRLYKVMNTRLGEAAYLGGADYSIADMACWPWVKPWKDQGQDLAAFPHLKRWFDDIAARPAVVKGVAVGEEWRRDNPVTSEEARAVLFGRR